jgi:hypothetical protein
MVVEGGGVELVGIFASSKERKRGDWPWIFETKRGPALSCDRRELPRYLCRLASRGLERG